MRHLEDAEAVALIRWRNLHAKKYPELALLFAIPNGGRRNPREAARLKAQGVQAGVSDYFLPVDRDEFPDQRGPNGLWLELKAGAGKPTPSQVQWQRLMREQGYAAEVCVGWIAAARCIADYLGLPKGIAP